MDNPRVMSAPHQLLPPPTTVVKLGGSLIGLPDLPARLRNLLGDFARPRPILVTGGGAIVDTLRDWDRAYGIGEETCHWLALRGLSITTRVVESLLPELTAVDAPEDCPALWREGRVPVYDAFHFIADVDEESWSALPRRWRVTSDSIAARMAETFGAPELVLLKSTEFPEGLSMEAAAEEGLVDPHFPTAARDLERVVAVNLRADEPEERRLYPEPRID